MKINFGDSFIESLNRIKMVESWWYKTYSFFRWDLWHFFKNVWRFRRELWEHNWWDYRFTLEILYRSISIMEEGMHNGLEVRETRDKKIEKMQRVLELIKNQLDDNFVELAEEELGIKYSYGEMDFEEVEEKDGSGKNLYRMIDKSTDEEKENNYKILQKSREIEEAQWAEIWEILKGQSAYSYHDQQEVSVDEEEKTLEDKMNSSQKSWEDWFDGSGLRGWWD